MRYDGENEVTGKKEISNIIINTLIPENDVYVQNVNILKWIQNAVLLHTNHAVSGKVVLHGDVEFLNSLE